MKQPQTTTNDQETTKNDQKRPQTTTNDQQTTTNDQETTRKRPINHLILGILGHFRAFPT